jgi:hypothetical protein
MQSFQKEAGCCGHGVREKDGSEASRHLVEINARWGRERKDLIGEIYIGLYVREGQGCCVSIYVGKTEIRNEECGAVHCHEEFVDAHILGSGD